MANLESLRGQDRVFGPDKNPYNGWVYESEYRWYHVMPSATPDSRAKFDRVGHKVMQQIAPAGMAMRSYNGSMELFVEDNRWTADSLKQELELSCFQAAAGDVTYTVTAATAPWDGGDYYDGGAQGNMGVDSALTYWREDVFGYAESENAPQTAQQIDDFGAGIDASPLYTDGTAPVTDYLQDHFVGVNTPGIDVDIYDFERNKDGGDVVKLSFIESNIDPNLGNYDSGRYNEFPLDFWISSSNIKIWEVDVDAYADDEASMDTAADTGWSQTLDGYFGRFLGDVNPLCWTMKRKAIPDSNVATDGVITIIGVDVSTDADITVAGNGAATLGERNLLRLDTGSHQLQNGDPITIAGIVGTTELNGNTYYVKRVSDNSPVNVEGIDYFDSDYIALYNDAALTDRVDLTQLTAYVSGGTATYAGTLADYTARGSIDDAFVFVTSSSFSLGDLWKACFQGAVGEGLAGYDADGENRRFAHDDARQLYVPYYGVKYNTP